MTKFIFHFYNIIIMLLYIYPGSLFSLIANKEPQIFPFFVFSLKHFYAFIILSFLGLISYYKDLRKIIFYLIIISIILELLHLYIPNREFQISDIFANISGVIIPMFLLALFKILKKKWKF